MTLPSGSVTRKKAFSSEILRHSSPRLSWMVAGSPVPTAARTSGMSLMMRLTEESRAALAFQRDV